MQIGGAKVVLGVEITSWNGFEYPETEPEGALATVMQLLENEDYEQALLVCDHGLTLDSNHIDLWLLKAKIHLEVRQWGLAEIALRTANAYGASLSKLRNWMDIALAQQGTSLAAYPLAKHNSELGPKQSPGAPEITALGRLAWHSAEVGNPDMLEILRKCPTMDQALAKMIAEPRFEKSNLPWLSLVREEDF